MRWVFLSALFIVVAGCASQPQPPSPPPDPYLPGLTAQQAVSYLSLQDIECTGPSKSGGDSLWACERHKGTSADSVTIHANADGRILSVIALSVQRPGDSFDGMAADLLGYVATLPYDGASQSESRNLVERLIPGSDQGSKAILAGGVRVALSGPREGRTMTISKVFD